MLAFDLYSKNKNFGGEFRKPRLAKKVMVKAGRATVDGKKPEEYGSPKVGTGLALQELLSLPLNTSPGLGLPFKATGPNSPKPYVEIDGTIVKNASGSKITLELLKGMNSFKAELDLVSMKAYIKAKDVIPLKMDREKYFLDDHGLFDEYVKSGILTPDAKLAAKAFDLACSAFFDFVKKKWNEEIDVRKTSFSLIILPSLDPVEYRPEQTERGSGLFIDAFGNEAFAYPISTTQTASFLSFDDKAFTINCKRKADFYSNLGIGDKSLKRINLPPESLINISGLTWLFMDLSAPEVNFQKKGMGIYHEMWSKYKELEAQAGAPYAKQSMMKAVCMKQSKKKLEILIDANLTMEDLVRMFAGVTAGQIPPLALEILIKRSGQNVIWTDYLDAVRAFVAGRRMERGKVTTIFSRILRRDLFKWIKTGRVDPPDFFLRSEFCVKILTEESYGHGVEDLGEQYAYGVGRIAGRYIKFKKDIEESSNSLKDILTYSKYDQEKLRYVVQRVSLGISLAKAPESELKVMNAFIKENLPAHEIPKEDSHKDYAYFYYKGAFQEMA